VEVVSKIKFLSGDNLSQIKSNLNKCLYITATHSLRRYRFETELAEFPRGTGNRLIAFSSFKIEILKELKEIGGYITNRDQRYVLSKVIETEFAGDKQKATMYGHMRHELARLYDDLVFQGVSEINTTQLDNIARNYDKSIAEIFKLYNAFLKRLQTVRAATDEELLHFDNQEGDFYLQHEVYSHKQRGKLKEYDNIVLDGFLFFNDSQKQLVTDALALGKNVVVIAKHNTFLQENIYEPLLKELGVEGEYITALPKSKPGNLQKISEAIFTVGKIQSLAGCRFIEPFLSREYEYKFIISEISEKLREEGGGTLDGVKRVLNETAVILRANEVDKQIIIDLLKDYGVFFLKTGIKNAPTVVYSKDEFLQSDFAAKFGYGERVKFFQENYVGLRIDVKRRSFIQYPIGQYICEVYNIIANGMAAESYKKLLYSNWHYNLGAGEKKYDCYISDFTRVQAFFDKRKSIEEWLSEISLMISNKTKLDADKVYAAHPLCAVSAESLLFLQKHITLLKTTVERLAGIKGKLSEHINGLKTLFHSVEFDNADEEEKEIVKELSALVDELAESNLVDVDSAYFARNIKSMLLEYEQEAVAEEDIDLCLRIVNPENAFPYKTAYFPKCEADKFPVPYNEAFPYTRRILSVLTDELGLTLTRNPSIDYHLEFSRFLFKNVLDFTTESLIFTQCSMDGGKPMSPSVYIEDLFSLVNKDIEYEVVGERANKSEESIVTQAEQLPFDMQDCTLSELQLFQLCPKIFYICNRHPATFKDSFQLGLYASGVVYYKFFERMANDFAGRIFEHNNELRSTARDTLKDLMKNDLYGFELLTSVELNNIYQKTLRQIEQFFEKIRAGKFAVKRFSFDLTAADIIEHNRIKVTVPCRVLIKSADGNKNMQFDITRGLEFLLTSGGGKKYEFKHYAEIISQLKENDSDDDRIALVNFLYFKIMTQFCHAQYRDDGVVRIKALIDEVKSFRFLNNTGIASDYCKCCKIKSSCREFEGGRYEN